MPAEVIDADAFLVQLLQEVPEAEPTVEAHLEDSESGLLLHPLIGDLLRQMVSAFASSQEELVKRILAVVDNGLVAGDEYVQNAVAVSFVEDFGRYEGETPELLALWPSGLRAELDRQS